MTHYYALITHNLDFMLVLEVEKYLAQGWKCQGGICVYIQNGVVFAQAMIKETE